MALMMRVPGIGLRSAGALLLGAVLMVPASTRAYYAGGGKKAENDCLIGYEFVDPSQVTDAGTKKQAFVCVDCDPSCDLDGVDTPNGSCTMAAGVCINQSGVTGCTPASGLDKATAKGNVKGVKGASGKVVIDTSQLLQGSACGAMIDVVMPLKSTKKGLQERKATIKLSALLKKNKSEGISKRKDKDKLTYVCQPRPAGEACPVATTTTTSSTTPTTAESTTSSSSTVTTTTSTTSSTVATTTSTTVPTTSTTSSTVATTTSTTVPTTSTTSSTVVSTTSTTVPTTSTTSTTASTPSTTSTTLVSTTSTTVVTTTSTTTTTINLCGNGMIDPGEECDGSDFGAATCPGSSTGAFLVCTPECTIDYSECPVVSTTSTTTPTSTTSTSSTVPTSTSTTVQTTSTSTTVQTTSTSTTVQTTSTSTTTMESTTTTTSTSTTTTIPEPTVLSFVTGAPGGTCGTVNNGGAGGTQLKALTCGGLNTGAGSGPTTVPEGPTPGGSETQFNISGGPAYTLSARTAAQTGTNNNCSDTGCNFGTWLPISGVLSTCVRNTFSSPGSGSLDGTTGVMSANVVLSSAVYLTNNAAQPCPLCIMGTVGVAGSGQCDPNWKGGAGVLPSPDAGNPCTPTDADGHNYECGPKPGDLNGTIPVNLSPLTTGTASKVDGVGGPNLFCPGQTVAGAFGQTTADYIEENGTPMGPVTTTPTATVLGSVFCIPSVGGAIDTIAGLPGPGATSLPGTLTLLP